jgi:hypothetical protein
MARATAFALRCTQSTTGLDVPPAVMRALAGRGPRAACSAAVSRLGAAARHRCEHAMPFLLADRGRDLLPAAREALLPSPSWVTARYRTRPAGAYLAHYRRFISVAWSSVTGSRG